MPHVLWYGVSCFTRIVPLCRSSLLPNNPGTYPSTWACSKVPRTRFLAELLILHSTVACFGLARARFKTPLATVSITDEVTPIALRDDTPDGRLGGGGGMDGAVVRKAPTA